MLKKIYLFIFILFITTSCSQKRHVVSLEPKIILPIQKIFSNSTSININIIDNRVKKFLSEINHNGKLLTINLSRDPTYLMKEVIEKQMIARGLKIKSPSHFNVFVQFNKLEAKIYEGTLHHNIIVNSSINLIITAPNGLIKTRSYTRKFSTQELLSANNIKIQNAVNNTLTDLISDMANDQEILDFINQNL
ncbi:YajG family lipoprotein [Candidatus Providencia siddallii]|uniref:Uncharacterized lipoprotein YajG n=1 Tax=Candidatus Providencia siddallii TaxID=1715285 RepID=A0ABM9NPC3_9GAMM